MKKVICLTLFAIAIFFSFVACSSKKSKEEKMAIINEKTENVITSSESNNVIINDEKENTEKENKILVTYFSWSSSHNTKSMAEYVIEATGGDSFEITPETPYTTVYNEVLDVAQKELRDNARPKYVGNIDDAKWSSYDVIFLGYPIWWYDAPMIIYSFLESHNFNGKIIIPFATSGGSRINEVGKFRAITNADVKDGLTISGFSRGDRSKTRVENWITELGYHK